MDESRLSSLLPFLINAWGFPSKVTWIGLESIKEGLETNKASSKRKLNIKFITNVKSTEIQVEIVKNKRYFMQLQ